MNIKSELENYIQEYPDRFNCRWLCKRKPELWESIKELTSFLDDSALPKQRCWHVLNDIFERPICPVAGIETSWFENRYLTYSSLSAKSSSPVVRQKMIETYEKRTGHVGHWSSNPELIERKRETFYSNIDNHLVQDFSITRAKDSAWYQNVQKAWDDDLKKKEWGDQMKQQWANYSPEDRKKWAEEAKTAWTEERRYQQSLLRRSPYSVARAYYVEVMFWTRLHWRESQELFNPEGLERSYWGNHIDHIYSIRDGFLNNVPGDIVGHWTNLKLIPREENQKKNSKSARTLEETVDLYMKNQR